MNKDNDLIERLGLHIHFMDKNRESVVVNAGLIRECIAALSPVLPEDVGAILDEWETEKVNGVHYDGDLPVRMRNLIERLAQHCENMAKNQRIDADILKGALMRAEAAESREKELEKYCRDWAGKAELAQQRIEELENRIGLLLHVTNGDKEKIAEYEKALGAYRLFWEWCRSVDHYNFGLEFPDELERIRGMK